MFLVRAAADCNCPKTHLSCILHTKVTEPTYSLDGNGIACPSSVTECVEGRNASAYQRCCIFRFKFVRYQDQCTCLCDHHLRVAAVGRDAGNDRILAIRCVTTATGLAGSVFA